MPAAAAAAATVANARAGWGEENLPSPFPNLPQPLARLGKVPSHNSKAALCPKHGAVHTMFQNSLFRSKIRAFALSCVCAAMVSACSTAPAGRTPIWLGQLSPGAPVIASQPRSWTAQKFDNLVRQEADFSCGAAVLATIFNYAYGYSTTERQVLVNMLKIADPDIVRQRGFSLLDMKTYSMSLGMMAEGYRVDYDQLARLEFPAIVLIDVRGYKHFVIARKVFGGRIAIGDPALGNRTMTRDKFESAWNGIAFVVMGEGYDPDTVLVDPPSPLSARRLLMTTASLPATEAAEYGFAPGYRF